MTIEPPVPRPGDPVTDDERQATIMQIQRAMAEGYVEFDELDDRFARVYEATTRAELATSISDLPQPPPPVVAPVGHPLPATTLSLFGDLEVGGWVSVETDLTYTTVFGDTVIDLSSSALDRDVTITTYSLFGDTTVIVPDGVRASIDGMLVFGDRKIALSAARAGTPTVRVRCFTVFGDARLYSLSLVPEGPFRRLWRALRGGS